MPGSAEPRGFEVREGAFLPISLASIRLDTITNFDIYFQPVADQPFVLYAERNIRFTDAVRRRLIDNKMSTVYIRSAQKDAYRRYLAENISSVILDHSVPDTEKAEMLYTTACGVVEAVLASPDSQEDIRQSKDLVRHTVDFMLADPRVFGCMLSSISTVYHVYTHSVNVVTYSVALAQRSGITDPALMRELAVGALLHDVGKSRIDPLILNSPESLSEDQWVIMKMHPKYGYDMLSQLGSVGEVALDIVLHHHERVRGGGYPNSLCGPAISDFVRIVSIADTFDALTTERPFQKAITSFNAISMMNTKYAGDFDSRLLRLFVSMMGHPGN
jgi:putative nucleotidyltransferase with HDIG domain